MVIYSHCITKALTRTCIDVDFVRVAGLRLSRGRLFQAGRPQRLLQRHRRRSPAEGLPRQSRKRQQRKCSAAPLGPNNSTEPLHLTLAGSPAVL